MGDIAFIVAGTPSVCSAALRAVKLQYAEFYPPVKMAQESIWFKLDELNKNLQKGCCKCQIDLDTKPKRR